MQRTIMTQIKYPWVRTVLLLFVCSCNTVQNKNNKEIEYYTVPFSCSVKAGLGCGSAARPVILTLLSDSNIDQTRLNYHGTILEITWAYNTARDERSATLGNAFFNWDFVPVRLNKDSIQIFKEKWFANLDIDSLSYEEAEENAVILMGLIYPKYIVPTSFRVLLQAELENYYRKELLTIREKDPYDKWETELNHIISQYVLDDNYEPLDFYHE
jgi:hypothetical protein